MYYCMITGSTGRLVCLPRIGWSSVTSRCICQSTACYSINKILTRESNIEHQTQGTECCWFKPICIQKILTMLLLRRMMHTTCVKTHVLKAYILILQRSNCIKKGKTLKMQVYVCWRQQTFEDDSRHNRNGRLELMCAEKKKEWHL